MTAGGNDPPAAICHLPLDRNIEGGFASDLVRNEVKPVHALACMIAMKTLRSLAASMYWPRRYRRPVIRPAASSMFAGVNTAFGGTLVRAYIFSPVRSP